MSAAMTKPVRAAVYLEGDSTPCYTTWSATEFMARMDEVARMVADAGLDLHRDPVFMEFPLQWGDEPARVKLTVIAAVFPVRNDEEDDE